MVEQVIASGGSCPWCSTAFNPDYAVTLVDMLREAKEAGTRFDRALDGLADLAPRFTLDPASLTSEMKRNLDRIGRGLVSQP
jgi:hypothetical protein